MLYSILSQINKGLRRIDILRNPEFSFQDRFEWRFVQTRDTRSQRNTLKATSLKSITGSDSGAA